MSRSTALEVGVFLTGRAQKCGATTAPDGVARSEFRCEDGAFSRLPISGWAMRSRILSTVVVLACALIAPAFAQQPQLDPILRIDPGMHTAMVKRVGVDDGCTLLATGSDDKTIRLWRLPEGKLLRTLRPPIGPGHDGKVFATAMSPDGTWVAGGGWDAAFQAAKTNHVYIFETNTGAIVGRVGETDGKVINHIAISRDGRRMAIARHLGQGVEVWQRVGSGLGDWRLEGRDSDYGGQPSYGVAFDRSGALYAVGYDGRLRRYAAPFNGRPDAIEKARADRPYSIAVHPSGERVAIGYDGCEKGRHLRRALPPLARFGRCARCRQRRSCLGRLVRRRHPAAGRRQLHLPEPEHHHRLGQRRRRQAEGFARSPEHRHEPCSLAAATWCLRRKTRPSASSCRPAATSCGRRLCKPTCAANTGAGLLGVGRRRCAFASAWS